MKFFSSATLALGITALAAGAAHASPYQQYKTGVCGSSSTCQIVFPNVPAGKTVELTNVSCYINTTAFAGIKKLQLQQLSASNAAGVSVSLAPAPYIIAPSTANQEDLGIANSPVTLYATAGQKFRARAEIVGGTFKEFSCHISGKI